MVFIVSDERFDFEKKVILLVPLYIGEYQDLILIVSATDLIEKKKVILLVPLYIETAADLIFLKNCCFPKKEIFS